MTDQGYDANSNPRHLAPAPDEYDEADIQAQITQVDRELRELGKVIGMYNSDGWKHVQGMLVGDMQQAIGLLAGDKITTMEGVAFIRGQIRQLERLISLGDEANARKSYLTETLRSLKVVQDA